MHITSKAEYISMYYSQSIVRPSPTSSVTFTPETIEKLRNFWENLTQTYLLETTNGEVGGKTVPDSYFVRIKYDFTSEGYVRISVHENFSAYSATKPVFTKETIDKQTLFDFLETNQN